MGRKDKQVSESESEEEQSCEEEEQIEEQVIKAIKKLPSLEEKVQAIALNGYLIQKREIDRDMDTEMTAVMWGFREKYQDQVLEIQKIVEGAYTFTDADFQDIGELLTEEELGVKNNYFTDQPVSEYWLKVLQSSDIVSETLTEKDEPVLRHLQKIISSKNKEGTNLIVEFFFSDNEWFTNKSIKKEFEIDGDDITKSFGDQIEWKEGKNITIKIVKKKNKKNKQKKTKIVREDSFFNFFKAIDLSGDDSEEEAADADEDSEMQVGELEQQYEMANHFYEDGVPRSLQYFLGVVGGGLGNMADFADLKGIPEEDDEVSKSKSKGKGKKGKKAKADDSD